MRLPATLLLSFSCSLMVQVGCGGSTKRNATGSGGGVEPGTGGEVAAGSGGRGAVGGEAMGGAGNGGANEVGGAGGEGADAGGGSGGVGAAGAAGASGASFTCCSSCDYEPACDGTLHTDYTLEYAGLFTVAGGKPVPTVAPGDQVVMALEVKDKRAGGYVHVGLAPADPAASVSVVPLGPVTFTPECTSIPFGGEGENYFDVTFGSDLRSGSSVAFLGWGSMNGDARECIGPTITFSITLD